jgi:hypothetical protein
MSEFLNHPDFFDKPVFLSETESHAPLTVLEEFFSDYSLSELRQILDDIRQVCLTTDQPPFSEPDRRADYLQYERHMISLLEAAFILAKGNSSAGR